jgi:hypothetical protein
MHQVDGIVSASLPGQRGFIIHSLR